MKNLITKTMIAASAFAMVAPMTVFAASSLKDSVGSVNASDDGTSVGVDLTQGQKTEYDDEITADSATNTCNVYATQASSFSVTIPKTIILDGDVNAVNDGTYVVTVKGNIGGNETITVAPDAGFKMKQDGKTDIDATVAQTATKFVVAEKTTVSDTDTTTKKGVDNASGVTETGTVTVSNLSAGSWAGAFNFNIALNTDAE